MTLSNLRKIYEKADQFDRQEGLYAYRRYRRLCMQIGDKYDLPLEKVVAVVAALSPSTNYRDNMRSAISVIEAFRNEWPLDQVTVSSYNHCRDRAWEYLHGVSFAQTVAGPKIWNFYHNILHPHHVGFVTIDGHAVNAWRNRKIALKKVVEEDKFSYNEVAFDFNCLAFELGLLPNQLQATIWFAWKRIHRIFYPAPQHHIWIDRKADWWQTNLKLEDLIPYGRRNRTIQNTVSRNADEHKIHKHGFKQRNLPFDM